MGEYWIEDTGIVVGADDDVNHEGAAFENGLGINLEEIYTKYKLEINANGIPWEEIADKFVEENNLEDLTNEELIDKLTEKHEFVLDPKSEDSPGRQVMKHMSFAWLGEHDANMEFVEWYWGCGNTCDAREYAIEHWGWIRVQGNNFQLWKLDDGLLDNVRNFIFEEYGEDEEALKDEEFCIEQYAPKDSWYTCFPYDDIMNKDAGYLIRKGRLETGINPGVVR